MLEILKAVFGTVDDAIACYRASNMLSPTTDALLEWLQAERDEVRSDGG